MPAIMQTPFIKMHGQGNDFLILDARIDAVPRLTAPLVRALADRHTGVGCDQLVLLEPSDLADFAMRIFNHDGGEVEACGNAARAIGLLHGKEAKIETQGGIVHTWQSQHGISVNMGKPRFKWDEIPLADAMDTEHMPYVIEGLSDPAAVNIGNPHVIFFVNNYRDFELEILGPIIEHDELFPARINVNIATVTNKSSIQLRVWERGAGITRACGTGACATAVAAMRRGLVGRTVIVTLPGGPLRIEWRKDSNIIMSGPASESFRGEVDFGRFRNAA